jgi:hypothetical protein
VPGPTGGSPAEISGGEAYEPSKQDKEKMLVWARDVVKATPGCDLPPQDRPPLDSDPPAIQLGFERLNDAVLAIAELAKQFNRLPTPDEAKAAAKEAISKARSQDVRVFHQTDAYDKRQKIEEGDRFDDADSQES